ncbi:MAG: nucleotidyltransferase family protein, partial [Acidobacteriota bacterium]
MPSHRSMIADRPPTLPPHWPRLIAAVERPESAADWAGEAEAWEAFLRDLQGAGLFPLAYRAWRASGVLESLPGPAREAAQARMAAYRAGWTGAWEEIAGVLGLFASSGLTPVLLKGADLALRYYPEPHLRPLTDLDVLFPTVPEAERAYAVLEGAGFRPGNSGIPMDDWVLSQHLPDLFAPKTGFPVEVHGALVVSPRDSRWAGRADRLLEGRRSYEWRGVAVEGLSPEALAVHLCGHMWEQHAGEPPKAGVVYDLRAVLEREGPAFDWDRLVDLSRASGFSEAVQTGLRALDAALGVRA